MDQIVVGRTGNITYAVARLTLDVQSSSIALQLLTVLDGDVVRTKEIVLAPEVVEPVLTAQAMPGKSRLEDLGIQLYSALLALGHIPSGQIST